MDLSADAMLQTLGLRPMALKDVANELREIANDDGDHVPPGTIGISAHVKMSSSSPTLTRLTDPDVDFHRDASAGAFDNDQTSSDLFHQGLTNFGHLSRAPLS